MGRVAICLHLSTEGATANERQLYSELGIIKMCFCSVLLLQQQGVEKSLKGWNFKHYRSNPSFPRWRTIASEAESSLGEVKEEIFVVSLELEPKPPDPVQRSFTPLCYCRVSLNLGLQKHHLGTVPHCMVLRVSPVLSCQHLKVLFLKPLYSQPKPYEFDTIMCQKD